MDAMRILFSSDIGLLSLATIVVVIGIGIYLGRFIKRQMEQDRGS